MKRLTHEDICEEYIEKGILSREQINKLNEELKITGECLDKAIKIVRQRKPFLIRIFYNLYIGFGRVKPEVREVWDELKKLTKESEVK